MTKLLLVEDNPLNSDILIRRLKPRGYELEVAATGLLALEMAQTLPVDLIIMDIALPDIDGHEVTRRLRAIPATADIPILALSANATEADRAQALQAGCNDYDSKPVDLPRFLAKIESLLKGASAPGQ